MALPRSFPEGTTFFDVEGIPVADIPSPDGGGKTLAFDKPEPRPFPASAIMRNGTAVFERDFRSAVALIASREDFFS